MKKSNCMDISSEISHEKTLIWLRKGNLKRESESLLITARNNAIKTSYVKAKIDKTQQNSECRLCGDWNETINHTIGERSKLRQKEYKIRHDLVGEDNKFKFNQKNKWYKHNPESVLKNEMHKINWDFMIQTDPLISVRQPDLVIIPLPLQKKNWENLTNNGLYGPGKLESIIKRKQKGR